MQTLKLSCTGLHIDIPVYKHITIIDAVSGAHKTHICKMLYEAQLTGDLTANVDPKALTIIPATVAYQLPQLVQLLNSADDQSYYIIDESQIFRSKAFIDAVRNTKATVIMMYRGLAFAEVSVFERLQLVYDEETSGVTLMHLLLDTLCN